MQMEICSHIGFSVNDVNSLHGFCMDALESAYGVVGEFSMDELGYGVTKLLNIQDDGEVVSGSMPPHEKDAFQMKDVCGEAHQSEKIMGTPAKVFSKCATFPCPSKILSSADVSLGGALMGEMNADADAINSEVLTHDDNAKSVDPRCSSALSLPKPIEPVSAMKGSREKRGVTTREKLTVKWAPDVYDPVPTSASHNVTNRPRKHGKKKSKNKLKSGSKSSRGSKGKDKDKKQVRKRGGNSSDMGFNYEEEVIHFCEIQPSDMDFNVGIPDLFCGSSFVNRFEPGLHLPSVAEAT